MQFRLRECVTNTNRSSNNSSTIYVKCLNWSRTRSCLQLIRSINSWRVDYNKGADSSSSIDVTTTNNTVTKGKCIDCKCIDGNGSSQVRVTIYIQSISTSRLRSSDT